MLIVEIFGFGSKLSARVIEIRTQLPCNGGRVRNNSR